MLQKLRRLISHPKAWPDLPHDDIKKRARLLVIDDTGFPYAPLFKKDHYSLDAWKDVSDLSKLETGFYDVILLDLQGVGMALSADHGLGVLKHIRQKNKTQIVIAYSSASFPIASHSFFDLADAILPKDCDYVDFKRMVDDLLKKRFSMSFYLDKIEASASGDATEKKRLRELSKEAILKSDIENLRSYLTRKSLDRESLNTILNIVQTAISIGSTLWRL